ncbi:hypothetical protein D9757_010600 [Collybiopsis confluens]|uniref:Rhodopsin domain-containing protein n=1 Tax=Collybiopsis confluens TaxID=2823264 RepID=A0A8H5GVC2_9AGAR|nr:hypothetical protein D9757_010600 [Collybiopsis confluens]
MFSNVHVSADAIRTFSIVFLIFAGSTVAARIFIRYRNQRLWWDDLWAVLSFLLTIVMAIGLCWTELNPASSPKDRRLQIAEIWILILTYSFGSWFGRISLLLSIIRLIPPIFTLRRISEYAFIAFCVMCMGLVIPKTYICASDVWWYKSAYPVCDFGGRPIIPTMELVTAVVGDLTLVVIPIRLFSHIALPKEKRRMLILIFGANLITTIFSTFHAMFFICETWGLLAFFNEAEPGSTLIMANLAVLAPYAYRTIRREGDFDSKPCTHYRSFQEDGGVRIRRISDLVPSDVPAPLVTTGPNSILQYPAACHIIEASYVSDPSLRTLSRSGSEEERKGDSVETQSSLPTLPSLEYFLEISEETKSPSGVAIV